jgi:hypothetical protein
VPSHHRFLLWVMILLFGTQVNELFLVQKHGKK